MAEESRLEIAVDSRGSERTVRRVSDELDRLERVGVAAQAGAVRTSRGFGAIASQAQFAVPPVGQLTSLLTTLTGVLGAREVIQYADAWQNAGNQLRQVTNSTEELERVQSTLMEVANSTRSAFEPTANLYSRLARSTTELGLSQQDLIGLTRTINQSFAVSGATAAEAGAAITQLSQGLAAGALRGDEFNSVSEQAPGIMRAIAESLNMTIGDLRDFAAEGGITAEIVVNALQGASDSIENDFGRSVETFGQKITIARNNLLQFVGSSNTVEGSLANIGDAAITLSESMDAVAQAGIVLGGVVAGRLTGRMITLAAGMTTAAGAATALRTALAFLGGPAGIAVAAATGIIAFRKELGLVPDPASGARREIELLTGALEDMNEASIDSAMIAINAKMFELESRAREVRKELESMDNSGSGALGMSPGATGQQARLIAEQGQIGAERGVLAGRMEELDALREGLGSAGEAGDRAGRSLNSLSDALEKFTPQASGEVQEILDRAGPGSSIDAQGQIRDAWGNTLPTLQRQLDAELQDQVRAFQSEQNLAAGLKTAAQAFIDNAQIAATAAFASIQPLSADEVANQGGGGLLATADQDSVPALAQPRGQRHTVDIKVNGDSVGEVQADDAFAKRLTDVLAGASSSV